MFEKSTNCFKVGEYDTKLPTIMSRGEPLNVATHPHLFKNIIPLGVIRWVRTVS